MGGHPYGRSQSVLPIFNSKVEKKVFSVPKGEKYDFFILYVLEGWKSIMEIFYFPSFGREGGGQNQKWKIPFFKFFLTLPLLKASGSQSEKTSTKLPPVDPAIALCSLNIVLKTWLTTDISIL